ncbi:MAG: hypothetical protein ACP5PW_07360 [Candidatus Dormibacteria bacterium]
MAGLRARWAASRIPDGRVLLSQVVTSRRALTVILALLLGVAVSLASFLLQTHYQAVFAAGGRLSGWQEFLRLGAPWQALPPVLTATVLAALGWLRLRSAAPEPSWSASSDRPPSASRLRAGLRRERLVVLAAGDAARVLGAVAVIRLCLYAGLSLWGSRVAADTLTGVLAEAAAWVLFAALAEAWRRRYLGLLESWGVS